jgi:hypothetical protein
MRSRIIIYGEVDNMGEEAVVAYLKHVFCNSYEITEEPTKSLSRKNNVPAENRTVYK